MISSKGKEGLALLAVVIVVVAALGVAVVVKDYNNDKSNPDDILGTYEMSKATQYEIVDREPGWSDTSVYDDEKVHFESYKDGIVTGWYTYDGVKRYSISGTYDPDTNILVLADLTLGSEINSFDKIIGSKVGDTLYLRGTATYNYDEDIGIYAYNLTLVKEGKTVTQMDFTQVLTASNLFTTAWEYECDYESPYIEKLDAGDVYTFNIFSGDSFRDGVYHMEITNANKTEMGQGAAVTVYQDSGFTILKCISIYDDALYTAWLGIKGDSMFVIESNVTFGESYDSYVTYETRNGSTPVFDFDNYGGSLMKATVSAHSVLTGQTTEKEYTVLIAYQPEDSMTAVASVGGGAIFINFWANCDIVSSFVSVYHDGANYYGDIMGYIDSKGNIDAHGVLVSGKGMKLAVDITTELIS